ncbi:MAG TPA: lysine--tRNA ligase [Candidatus Azoamicus sp. OHIO2]
MNINCNYFNKFKRSHIIQDVINIFNKTDSYYFSKKEFSLCGRIYRKRLMGQACFLELRDMSSKIQIYISHSNIKDYKTIINNITLGDIIGVKGLLFTTKSNELSLKAVSFYILAKNLKSFPDKQYGLLDKELCYRHRYIDLLVNAKSKKTFLFRSELIHQIRKFFMKKKFIEVETPIMQNIIGGADAEPFKTYINCLNEDLYFRISPELYLKKLIVGGFEKVFEIGKNFRNEGLSKKHHPEFTMIEFYEAYANYTDMMNLTEQLFKYLVNTLFNNQEIFYNNTRLNFTQNFTKINFFDAIIKYCDNISFENLNNKELLLTVLIKNNIEINTNWNINDLQCKIFDIFVEKNLITPTFILHHPLGISPLSKTTDYDSNIVERFELYICGKEIANGFSELNNPYEQKLRFLEQLNNKHDKSLQLDDDYITSLEYALPPTGGEGIGIDRLTMLFTNSMSIKDVILFPLMKNK